MTAQELRGRLREQSFYFNCLMIADKWRAEMEYGIKVAKPIIVLNFGEAVSVVGDDAVKAFEFGMIKHCERITRHATPGTQVFQVLEWSEIPDLFGDAYIRWESGSKEIALEAGYFPFTVDALEELCAK